MIQIKKTILTLVALLAVTTGAWADETPLLTIESKDNTDFKSGSKTFDDKVTVTFSNQVSNSGNDAGWYTWESSLLTVAGTNGYTITSCKFYTEGGVATTGYTIEGESPSVYLYDGYVYTDANYSVKIGALGVMKIEVYGAAASSATPVDGFAWDKATKTGTFKMPGGNVTLEPEYYPQATVADGAVTAADADARATTDDPLVKVDATKLTGAKKLMYFVSNSGTAPAYDAEGWTDQLPTAEGFTQQGIVYVWYYPVGTDEGVDGATATYSDGDMNATALAVSLAAAPLWNAEFDLTDAPEADKAGKWSTDIPEGGVVKGTEVKVTYTGSKKVIGVKAEKKAAPTVFVTAITLNKTTTTIYKVNDSSTETLSVTAVTPDEATDKTYTWSSDNTAVATVDASTGEVTAVAVGTAHIRATANDGTGVYGECTVTVSDLSAYYSKMKECGCDDLENKCVTYDDDDNSHFTGQVLSAAQAIALAKAKAAETGSNCAVFYDNGYPGQIRFAKNDGTTGQGFCDYSASQKGLSGYKGYYVSK